MAGILFATPGCDKAPQPTAEVVTAPPLDDGRIPTTAIDPHTGAVYVAFFRTDGAATNVYLARKDRAEAAWHAPVRVSSGAEDANPHAQAPPQLAVGPQGQVYVAWTNAIPIEGRRFAASNLYLARSTDGGQTFSPRQAVNTDAAGLPASHTFHDLAVGPDGTIYVTWLDSRAKDREQAKHAGKVPVRPASLSAPYRHEVGSEVWMAVSHDEGRTFREAVVAKNTCECCRTSVEVAADNTVYVAWRHRFPNGERDIALASSSDGGTTFSDPVRVHADGWAIEGCPHTGPSLAVDTDNRIHIAWYTGAASNPALYYTISEDGGRTFAPPQTLAAGVPVSQVKLGGNRHARIWVAWEDATTGHIRVAYTNDGAPLAEVVHADLPVNSPAIAAVDGRWILAGQVEDRLRVVLGAGGTDE